MPETTAQAAALCGMSDWPPEYLDLSGVARLLSTTKKQVQRMLASGRLPAADINISATGGPKGRRWRRERVIEWLEAHV